MNYLLDTNHWSHLQRGHPAVVSRLQSMPAGTTFYMPVVAQAELLAGVELVPDGARKEELRRLYRYALERSSEILPIDSRVAERFAVVVARLQAAGRPIETNDIWVAAIAFAHDLTVVTNDAHFRFIDGLRVEDWTIAT